MADETVYVANEDISHVQQEVETMRILLWSAIVLKVLLS